MTAHQTRAHKKGGTLTRLAIVACAILAFLALAGFVRETLRKRQIASEVAGLQAEADRLETRNFEIAALRRSLDSGEFVEREARTKLGLKKEGEIVVVLTRPTHAQTPDMAASAPAAPSWSNAKKWFMYFADQTAFHAYAGR